MEPKLDKLSPILKIALIHNKTVPNTIVLQFFKINGIKRLR